MQHVLESVLHRPAGEGRRVSRTRNAIVHSFEELRAVAPTLPEVTAVAHAALVAGVLDLLGGPHEEIRRALRLALELVGDASCVAVVRLEEYREARLPAGALPTIRLYNAYLVARDGVDLQRDHDAISAVALTVSVDGYDGEWEPVGATLALGQDPERPRAPVQFLLQRAVNR